MRISSGQQGPWADIYRAIPSVSRVCVMSTKFDSPGRESRSEINPVEGTRSEISRRSLVLVPKKRSSLPCDLYRGSQRPNPYDTCLRIKAPPAAGSRARISADGVARSGLWTSLGSKGSTPRGCKNRYPQYGWPVEDDLQQITGYRLAGLSQAVASVSDQCAHQDDILKPNITRPS